MYVCLVCRLQQMSRQLVASVAATLPVVGGGGGRGEGRQGGGEGVGEGEAVRWLDVKLQHVLGKTINCSTSKDFWCPTHSAFTVARLDPVVE